MFYSDVMLARIRANGIDQQFGAWAIQALG